MDSDDTEEYVCAGLQVLDLLKFNSNTSFLVRS